MGDPTSKESGSGRPVAEPSVPPADKTPWGAPDSPRIVSAPPPRASSTPPPVPNSGRRDEDPLIGTVLLDRVRVDRPLARGGMGKVYYGELVRMKRPCAIKVLDPRLAAGGDIAEFTRRFLLEASIAAKLTHPNVVTIFDYGETADGSCFIAMELLEGRSLSDELKAVGSIPAERAIHITRQVARALREAHTLGVVHRDMKPGNVYLVKRDDDEDFAKVLDFGLVKETSAPEGENTQLGQIMGSPRYMAPEQVQGKHVDARTDIYAVGATLYAMLAGRPPFDKATDLATMMAHVSDPAPPIGSVAPNVMLPFGLEAVVLKCLAKNPDERYGSMEELIGALKLRPGGQTTASDSGGHSAPAPRLMPPVIGVDSTPPRRKATPWIMALALAAVVGLGVTFMSRQDPAPPPGPAGAISALPPPPVPVPITPPPPAVPKATSTLHVDSDPPGARVKEEGDIVCEATPCDIVYTGDQADPTVEHLLTFLKPDYRLERKLVKVSASPFSLKMTRVR